MTLNTKQNITEDALQAMPWWATIVLALRSAMRVQELYQRYWAAAPSASINALQQALNMVQDACRNGLTQGVGTNVIDAVETAVRELDGQDGAEVSRHAANAVLLLCQATTVRVIYPNASGEYQKNMLVKYVMKSLAEADCALGSSARHVIKLQPEFFDSIRESIRYDYARLQQLSSLRAWNNMEPIDPDLLGPLVYAPRELTIEYLQRKVDIDADIDALKQRVQILYSAVEKEQNTFGSLQNKHADALTYHAAIKQALSQINQSIAASIARERDEYNAAIAQAKQSIDGIEIKLNKALEDAIAAMRQKVALELAVEYWDKKARGHKWRSISFGVALLVAMLLFIVLMGMYIPTLMQSDSALAMRPQIPFAIDSLAAASFWSTTTPARLVYSTLVIVIGIWILRLIARLFLSNLHLYTDAKEKRVMTMSYLSLLAQGAFKTDRGEEFMLERMFRSAGTGIMKEDGSPTHPLQDVAALLQKR